MGGAICAFFTQPHSILLIKTNYFYNNSADFGAGCSLEYINGLIYVVKNFFQSQSIPKHVIGGGTCVEIRTFPGVITYCIANVYNESFSLSMGALSSFQGNQHEINSIFLS